MPIPALIGIAASFRSRLEEIEDFSHGDPEALAGFFSQHLVYVTVLAVLGYVGLLSATCAVGFGRYRPRWLFWSLVVLSVLYLLSVPVGTVLAVACGVVLWVKRSDFSRVG